jgi:hypothetical protein
VPTDATDALLLLHTPPAIALVKVVLFVAQTTFEPVIVPALGSGLTVAVFVVN